jgi:hypothetical protein
MQANSSSKVIMQPANREVKQEREGKKAHAGRTVSRTHPVVCQPATTAGQYLPCSYGVAVAYLGYGHNVATADQLRL